MIPVPPPHVDRFADDARLAPEPPLPVAVIQNEHEGRRRWRGRRRRGLSGPRLRGRRWRNGIAIREVAANRHASAEDLEKVRRHAGEGDLLGLVAGNDDRLVAGCERRDILWLEHWMDLNDVDVRRAR